jgi:hypothetical protein
MRPREEVERYWRDPQYRPDHIQSSDAAVRFVDAPADHGTEIHVELTNTPGKLGGIVQKLRGGESRAKIKDDLRRFKQHVETGVITRSESSPEGELVERKLKQRPAQPLKQDELQKAGV